MSADEDDYEVHVFATTDEDGYSDGLVPEPEAEQTPHPHKKSGSSGLIRVGLLLLVLLGVAFLVHRMWGTQIARYYLNEPSPDEQFAPIDPLIYSEAVDVWSLARGNLRISQNTQTAATGETDTTKTLITALEQDLVQSDALSPKAARA